jgi:hypothetical protein
MATRSKRATVFVDAELHRAPRLKVAGTEQFVSELVNEAIPIHLPGDADGPHAARDRATKKTIFFEGFVSDSTTRGPEGS